MLTRYAFGVAKLSLGFGVGIVSGLVFAAVMSRPAVAQSEVCVSQPGGALANLGPQNLLREVACPAGVSGRCWVPGPNWSQYSALSPSQAGLCEAIAPPLAVCQVEGNTALCTPPPSVLGGTSANPIVPATNPLLFFVRSPDWVGKWWVQSQWQGYPDRGSRWEFAVVQTPTGSGCIVQMRGGDNIPCLVAGDVLTWRGTMEGELMDVRLTRQGSTIQGEFIGTSLTSGQNALGGRVTGTLQGGPQARLTDPLPRSVVRPNPPAPNLPVYVVP